MLLSVPLTSLFCKICCQSIFLASWKISCITPVFKKGSRLDPTCYRPVAVGTFRFMRSSSALDAGVSLASTITTAINQQAEAQLVVLDIKGAFDSVWWKGFLNIGFHDRKFRLFESYLSNQYNYRHCYTFGFFRLVPCFCWSSSGGSLVFSLI